jgi:diaminohydroxyphosphoribosylaminopyrimidine deaminase / 5-amino-6-(5-phosphoribosylamino)uracil reductase
MTAADTDISFLRRAIRLAMNGRGLVEPNPMVGCVLVRDGQIIGEGWHAQFGGPHAEPAALDDCHRRGNTPEGATAYVTLEPCCHTNKKTPPCAPKLIEAKVARVVIGCLDPNPEVNGRGAAMLRAAGIQVDGPVLEAEAMQLIAPFLARIRHGRPYVTLKWAQTADGKVAGPGGRRMQISNATSTRLVHQLRARSDAILVGINSVFMDDPLLTARDVPSPRRLLRVVLDAGLRLPTISWLVQTAANAPVLVYTGSEGVERNPGAVEALRSLGVDVVSVDGHTRPDIAAVLSDLGQRGVTHLMVEGGPTVHQGFFASGYVDRLWVFRSPQRVDDSTAPSAPTIPPHLSATQKLPLSSDVLTEYLDPRSDVFFAPVPSADLVLAAEQV